MDTIPVRLVQVRARTGSKALVVVQVTARTGSKTEGGEVTCNGHHSSTASTGKSTYR